MMNYTTPETVYLPELDETKELNWNVIPEEDFKERVRFIFSNVSNVLAKTAGPFGSTTILERYGEPHITKDGLNVLSSIHFKENTDRNILSLLSRISIQVANLVGDGTTSSILVANKMLEKLEEHQEIIDSVMPRDIVNIMNICSTLITNTVYNIAKPVTIDSGEIHNLAYISTNGSKEIATMISDIYKQTENPSIEYKGSKTSETYIEIVDGFKMEYMTYIDNIFINSDNNICRASNPLILIFNYKLDIDESLRLVDAAVTKAREEGKTLFVIAPYYSPAMLERIKRTSSYDIKQHNSLNIIYLRASLVNAAFKKLYNDFAVLTGGQIVTEQDIEILPSESDGKDLISLKEEYDRLLTYHIGTVGEISVNDAGTTITGLYNKNEEMYSKIVLDAETEYNNKLQEFYDRSLTDLGFTEAKNRISKLRGKMGTIYVGGYTTLEQKAKYDLVEDAVKACESAYLYGYVIGSNLVTPYVIESIILSNDKYVKELDEFNPLTSTMLRIIKDAYEEVFQIIFNNKYTKIKNSSVDIKEVFNTCITEYKSFDITTDEFSNAVINSSRTDVEILKGAISILSLLISSNQYISVPTGY